MRSRPYTEYLDKYYGGKKNHSFWREWTIERSLFAGSISYFLLRDVSIISISYQLETFMPDVGSCSGYTESSAYLWEFPRCFGLESIWKSKWSTISTFTRFKIITTLGEMFGLLCSQPTTTRFPKDMLGKWDNLLISMMQSPVLLSLLLVLYLEIDKRKFNG